MFSLHIPKSAILICPSLSSRILSSFRSLENKREVKSHSNQHSFVQMKFSWGYGSLCHHGSGESLRGGSAATKSSGPDMALRSSSLPAVKCPTSPYPVAHVQGFSWGPCCPSHLVWDRYCNRSPHLPCLLNTCCTLGARSIFLVWICQQESENINVPCGCPSWRVAILASWVIAPGAVLTTHEALTDMYGITSQSTSGYELWSAPE